MGDRFVPEKKKSNLNHKDWITIICAIPSIIFLIVFFGYGSVLKYKTESSCTEYTTAVCMDANSTPYFYAPYHGGRIEERADYVARYVWTLDDKIYEFYLTGSYGKGWKVPQELEVKYNPDNPEIFCFNQGPWWGSDEVWTYVGNK